MSRHGALDIGEGPLRRFGHRLPAPGGGRWTKAIIAAAMFFTSVILHELEHSLVGRRHGVGIASITLFVFGGVSEMRDEPRTPRDFASGTS